MQASAACLALMLPASALHATIILSDDFSYPDGPVTNAVGSPWVTHSSNDPNEEVVVAGGKAQLTFARGDDVNASLPNQPYTTGGGAVLYTSFSVNFSALPSSAGSYSAHFNPASNHRARVWASTQNAPGNLFRIGIGNGTSASASSGQLTNNLALNTTYTVVTRYNVGTGASTIWLNPSDESDFSVTASDAPAPVTITVYSFRQSTGMGTLLVDDLRVGTSFAEVVATNQPPVITTQPQSEIVTQGSNATFSVVATGAAPLSYQWQFNATNLAGATSSVLTLTNVTAAQAGTYTVTVTNAFGSTNSQPATLTVNPATPVVAGFSLLTYNVKGNGATNWSTNAPQVRAIARQLQYLNPDIIAFQEIPFDLSYEMTNFVSAFLPGYALARNSGTDGSIRSAIASRFPITRSTSWLDGIDLRGFGYSNANNSLDNFTRDLFEAQINVPGFAQPLHVFTTHLKATSGTTYADAAAKRAAEAAAITNFFVTNLFVLHPNHPYILTGDMNDSDTNALAVQRLISAPTGLRLTNPTNPFTGSLNTYSIQGSLNSRLDFIFPNGLLRSNVNSSQVFRTDLLTSPPPPLLTSDSATASDHLPVLMVFNNPYDKPFRLLSITRNNPNVTLTWQSVPGQPYRVDTSSNLTAWSVLASNLTATGSVFTFTANVTGGTHFFRVHRVP